MKNRIEIRCYCQLIAEINTTHWKIERSENELQTILKTLIQE